MGLIILLNLNLSIRLIVHNEFQKEARGLLRAYTLQWIEKKRKGYSGSRWLWNFAKQKEISSLTSSWMNFYMPVIIHIFINVLLNKWTSQCIILAIMYVNYFMI